MSNKDEKGEHIIITPDPFGREIRFKDATWNYHVVGGDHARTEFIGQEKVVERVLSDPGIIIRDEEHETREKYLDLVHLTTMTRFKVVVIVVDHKNPEFGDVVSMWPEKTIKQSSEGGIIYVRGQRSSTDR